MFSWKWTYYVASLLTVVVIVVFKPLHDTAQPRLQHFILDQAAIQPESVQDQQRMTIHNVGWWMKQTESTNIEVNGKEGDSLGEAFITTPFSKVTLQNKDRRESRGEPLITLPFSNSTLKNKEGESRGEPLITPNSTLKNTEGESRGEPIITLPFSNSTLQNKDGEEALITLPYPGAMLPTKQLLQQHWVDNLRQILSEIPLESSSPLHSIVCNYKYREVLLNWLIVAKVRANPPVTNVIILSLDQALCDLLSKRDIPCLHISPKYVIRGKLLVKLSPFHQVNVMRLTVIRFLNYWGYDVANYDADALILKNPKLLYQEFKDSDMVASRGRYPFELGSMWGDATICTGMFMLRSTKNTGT